MKLCLSLKPAFIKHSLKNGGEKPIMCRFDGLKYKYYILNCIVHYTLLHIHATFKIFP